MKKLLSVWILVISLLFSRNQCFVNKHTSRIYDLNVQCLADSAWNELERYHSIKNLNYPRFINKLPEFKKAPFSNVIYFFDEPVPQLVAISTEHDCVRYVYNPMISEEILDGLSLEFPNKEKLRVASMVQSFLRKYQCEEEKTNKYKQEWDE